MTIQNTVELLAIRTGRNFTLVHVDLSANQCSVATCPRTRTRYGAAARVTHQGVGERSIQRAARDCAGQTFRTRTRGRCRGLPRSRIRLLT